MVQVRSRTARTAALAVSGVAALSLTFAAGVAYAADQRLEEADGALEKAAALLEASQIDDGVPPQVQEKFERKVARAIDLVERARDQVTRAQEIADGAGD